MRWKDEKPDLSREEFIDDIPYPETQNYVKRILGTAEDYRRLYGDGQAPPAINRGAPGKSLAGLASTNGNSTSSTAKKATAKTTKKATAKRSTAKKTTKRATSRKATKTTAKKTTKKAG